MDFDHPRPEPFNYRSGDLLMPHVNFTEPLRYETETFVECLRNGGKPITGIAHARNVISILEQADRVQGS